MEPTTKELVIKARGYEITEDSARLLKYLQPLILSGVTAAGKNATSSRLESMGGFNRVVTHTTRRLREGETNGQDYWFVSDWEMLEFVNNGLFIEVEVLNGDRVYGTSRQAMERGASDGKKPIMAIDLQGAAKIAKVVSGLRPLFMVPPSTDVWMQRLGGRAYMSDGEHDRRLHGAQGELEFVLNNPDFLVVINNDIEQAASEIARGVSADYVTQNQRRTLVRELYEYARSSNM